VRIREYWPHVAVSILGYVLMNATWLIRRAQLAT
jgi:hypothetical protein